MAEELLDAVAHGLGVKGRSGRQIMRELHSHLQASQYELELAGRAPDDAARESVRRFGDAEEVAEMLTAVHRTRVPKVRLVAAITLALAGISAWFGTSGTFAAPHRPMHVQRSMFNVQGSSFLPELTTADALGIATFTVARPQAAAPRTSHKVRAKR
jgi:hypothetical protein